MLQMLPLDACLLIAPLFFRPDDVEPQAYFIESHATRFTFGNALVPLALWSAEHVEHSLCSAIASSCSFVNERSIAQRFLLAHQLPLRLQYDLGSLPTHARGIVVLRTPATHDRVDRPVRELADNRSARAQPRHCAQ